MSFIDVGFANYMDANKIIQVSQVDSSPIKRVIKQAKEEGRFVDVTQGRKTRAVVYSECGNSIVVTAVAVHAPTVVSRIEKAKSRFVQKNVAKDLVQIDSDQMIH